MRDITTETNKVQTGKSVAQSSHKGLNYNLISPRFIKRLAKRLTVGADKYGSVQWRQGINDADYVTDRWNHFIDHLLKFMEDGNTKDDNLGAMIWGLHALVEVEELAPAALSKIIGTCKLFGEEATKVHTAEMTERANQETEENTARHQAALQAQMAGLQNAYPGVVGQNSAPQPNETGFSLSNLFRRN